jgi:hypothetical protein
MINLPNLAGLLREALKATVLQASFSLRLCGSPAMSRTQLRNIMVPGTHDSMQRFMQPLKLF